MGDIHNESKKSPELRRSKSDLEIASPKKKMEVEDKPEVNKNEMFDAIFDFMSSSDINGISYLTDPEKSIPDKIMWFVIFLVSLVICVLSILEVFLKWQDGAIAIVASPVQVSVWEIPFPAVTICPLSKVRKSQYDYARNFQSRSNLTGDELKKFWDVTLVCDLQGVKKNNADSITDEDVITNMKEVAPNVEDTILDIVWKDNIYNLITDHPFSTQVTGEGVCFTFNSFSKSDLYTDAVIDSGAYLDHDKSVTGWALGEGYSSDKDMYPDRIAQAGAANSLNIKLHSLASDRDLSCGDTVSGYKVLLHNPAETPRVTQQFFLAPTNKQVTLAVIPKVEQASKELKAIPLSSRNCFFTDERQLKYYKVYTKNNCEMECLMNMTAVFCGCLPYYAARDNDTIICGYRRSFCQVEARVTILRYENLIKKGELDKIKEEAVFPVFEKCNCLPGCNALDYDGATSLTDFHFTEDNFKKTKFVDIGVKHSDLETTNLKVFWKEGTFPSVGRESTFGQTDFLSSVGGLLGLFLGMSASSIVEIVQFVVVNVFWKLISGAPDTNPNTGMVGGQYGRPTV